MISYFFLDLKGDTSDGALLDSLHQVSGETGDFISHSLGGEDGNIGKDLFIEVEISGELAVVLFDQDLGGSLNSLSSDSALQDALESRFMKKCYHCLGVYFD